MPTLSGILLDADNEVVHIAVVDAPSHELLDALHFATTRRIDIVCWTRQQMEGHTHTPQKMLPVVVSESSATAAGLLNQTFQSALAQRASDIHFEPAEHRYQIRLRVDGVLHVLPEVTTEMGIAITARLKVLGSLDIAEHRLPQDGQFTIEISGQPISFRISTLPVVGVKRLYYGYFIRSIRHWISPRWACRTRSWQHFRKRAAASRADSGYRAYREW